MRVVLPIAAIVAILTAAAVVSGGVKLTDGRASVDLEPAMPAGIAPYPAIFDSYTGLRGADLAVTVEPDPERSPVAQGALPLVEVDPFARYGVGAPPVPLVRAVTGPWGGPLVTFAEVRARYAPADALPTASSAPVATDAWWTAAPLDAK